MKQLLRIGLIASYAVAPVWLQAVHLAGDIGRPACAACTDEAADSCDSMCCAGGCGDSEHHHHDPAHHHDQCAICKASVAQAATVVETVAHPILPARSDAAATASTAMRRGPPPTHPSRAPPAIA